MSSTKMPRPCTQVVEEYVVVYGEKCCVLIFGLDMVLNLSLLKKLSSCLFQVCSHVIFFLYNTHTHAGTKMCIGETAPPLQVVRETLLLLFPIIFNLTLFLRLYEWASKLHNKAAAHTFNQIMSRRGLLPLGTFCLFRN